MRIQAILNSKNEVICAAPLDHPSHGELEVSLFPLKGQKHVYTEIPPHLACADLHESLAAVIGKEINPKTALFVTTPVKRS
jgi:hypothetical protein